MSSTASNANSCYHGIEEKVSRPLSRSIPHVFRWTPMGTDRRIDYVELPAADFDVVQKFYEQAFGWTFTDYGDGYRAFRDGSMDGGFYKSDLKSTTQMGAALIILYADDLEATLQQVQEAGGTIVVDILSFPGGRRFQFTDPHGNELGVWSDRGIDVATS